jgi:hypothetical protein
MKINLFPLLAAAGFAVQYASAVPIRVVVVTSHQEVSTGPNIRIGHAAANNNANRPAAMTAKPHRRPCAARLRDKALNMSNTFRKMFGLPLIETKGHGGGAVNLIPLPFIGTPVNGGPGTGNGDTVHILPVDHERFRNMKHHGHKSFFTRVHHAIQALGPWEGRAVAFVLGCGIGVLLRMMWVMTVITYRMIKGDNDERPEYAVVCEHYAEDILVPPPQYTYGKLVIPEGFEVDEKLPMEN